MRFRNRETTVIPVAGVEWRDGFIACTRHLIDVLKDGGEPVLDDPTGKAMLSFQFAERR